MLHLRHLIKLVQDIERIERAIDTHLGYAFYLACIHGSNNGLPRGERCELCNEEKYIVFEGEKCIHCNNKENEEPFILLR